MNEFLKNPENLKFDMCMFWDMPFDIRDYIADIEEDLRKENFEGRILFDFTFLPEEDKHKYVFADFKNGKLNLPLDKLPPHEVFDWSHDDSSEGDFYQDTADFLFEHYGKGKELAPASKLERKQEERQEEMPERSLEKEYLFYEQLKLF